MPQMATVAEQAERRGVLPEETSAADHPSSRTASDVGGPDADAAAREDHGDGDGEGQGEGERGGRAEHDHDGLVLEAAHGEDADAGADEQCRRRP